MSGLSTGSAALQLSPEQQLTLPLGKVLKDGKNLKDYNIQNESELILKV